MSIKTLEQGRAAFAYKCAEIGAKLKEKKEYKQYVKKVPMLIKTNGLGATFAFMLSKGGTYKYVYDHTFEWFKELAKTSGFDLLQLGTQASSADFIAKIISLESTEYRAVTIETLAFLNWLKRFSSGLIEG